MAVVFVRVFCWCNFDVRLLSWLFCLKKLINLKRDLFVVVKLFVCKSATNSACVALEFFLFLCVFS